MQPQAGKISPMPIRRPETADAECCHEVNEPTTLTER